MKFLTAIFDLKNLNFNVNGQTVLSNISLEIFSGQYIAIIVILFGLSF